MSEEQAVAVVEPKPERVPLKVQDGMIVASTLAEQYRFAQYVVASRLVPAKTAEEALVVMQRGAELGFKGLAAYDVLYCVNGKVRLTPQGAKAKAMESGLVEDAREEVVGEGDNMEAVVTVKRKGLPTPIVSRFSIQDARRARLITGKEGAAWTSYPKRMLLARARGFAYQDAFPDLCGGLQVRETYDLEPGEQLSAAPSTPTVRAKTGNDPIFAALRVKVPVVDQPAAAEAGAPFPSHAEADRAIAESEK